MYTNDNASLVVKKNVNNLNLWYRQCHELQMNTI